MVIVAMKIHSNYKSAQNSDFYFTFYSRINFLSKQFPINFHYLTNSRIVEIAKFNYSELYF